MSTKIDSSQFAFTGEKTLQLKKVQNLIDPYYESKKDYKKKLEDFREEIDELQNMMYAHDRYGMLLIFQAMDAAGKDGTIRHVMSGVNPHGIVVHSFKKPTSQELDHDYLWRTTRSLPERGRIGIFNRSYYEEVLVVRVHPGILTGGQRVPKEFIQDVDQVWEQRYEDIRNFETYISRNGIHVIKFFLNLSKEEQRQRFLARIDTPSKNWKFSEADVRERGYWDDYQKAYEEAINQTAAPHAPWYVIPADDKKNMRLIVSQIILDHMKSLDMNYPVVDDARKKELQEIRKQLAEG
ncbi:MAG: polyphosphate kinase 2 family protein [Bacteroidota bacterium]